MAADGCIQARFSVQQAKIGGGGAWPKMLRPPPPDDFRTPQMISIYVPGVSGNHIEGHEIGNFGPLGNVYDLKFIVQQ